MDWWILDRSEYDEKWRMLHCGMQDKWPECVFLKLDECIVCWHNIPNLQIYKIMSRIKPKSSPLILHNHPLQSMHCTLINNPICMHRFYHLLFLFITTLALSQPPPACIVFSLSLSLLISFGFNDFTAAGEIIIATI